MRTLRKETMSTLIEKAREAVNSIAQQWTRERLIASAVAEYNDRMEKP